MAWLFVITGASRGIGASLAGLAVDEGHEVLAIARGECPAGRSVRLDLGQPETIEQVLPGLLGEYRSRPLDGVVLVNNAATIDPIGNTYSAAEATRHVAVNLVAPAVLTRLFLDVFASLAIAKRIVNVTSGAAQRAFEGWSLYGASKAGLDHFGRCLALEQQRVDHPADVVALSPGVVDTAMQASIRAADETQFPLRPMFDELKAGGRLADPQDIARLMLRGILGPRRYEGAVVRVEDFGDTTPAARV
jgi:benzil reductase ((S)-benzoin forming)